MTTISVDVPVSLLAEVLAQLPLSKTFDLGYKNGTSKSLGVLIVRDEDMGTDKQKINFCFMESGSTRAKVTLSIFDIINCESYKRAAASREVAP